MEKRGGAAIAGTLPIVVLMEKRGQILDIDVSQRIDWVVGYEP